MLFRSGFYNPIYRHTCIGEGPFEAAGLPVHAWVQDHGIATSLGFRFGPVSYANDVVAHVQNACDEAGVPHPTIVSESGRAVVAYHSMLIFGVLGVSEQGGMSEVAEPSPEAEQPLHDLWETYQGINVRNLLESYHDAQQSLDTAMSLFSSG